MPIAYEGTSGGSIYHQQNIPLQHRPISSPHLNDDLKNPSQTEQPKIEYPFSVLFVVNLHPRGKIHLPFESHTRPQFVPQLSSLCHDAPSVIICFLLLLNFIPPKLAILIARNPSLRLNGADTKTWPGWYLDSIRDYRRIGFLYDLLL